MPNGTPWRYPLPTNFQDPTQLPANNIFPVSQHALKTISRRKIFIWIMAKKTTIKNKNYFQGFFFFCSILISAYFFLSFFLSQNFWFLFFPPTSTPWPKVPKQVAWLTLIQGRMMVNLSLSSWSWWATLDMYWYAEKIWSYSNNRFQPSKKELPHLMLSYSATWKTMLVMWPPQED